MISVCICTFNGEAFLEDQLKSIINQKDFKFISEIVICDDVSTDSTIKLIKKFSKNINQIKLIINKKRLGVKKNFEKCLGIAKSPIIILCDQDDIWDKQKITKIINNNEIFSLEPVAIIHNASLINSENTIIEKNFMRIINGFSSSIFKNFYKNRYLGCCLTINRSLKNMVLPFPLFLAQHDIWIGIVSSLNAKVIFLDEPLTFYRSHGKNLSPASKNQKSSFVKIMKFRLFFIFGIILGLIRKYKKF